MDSRTATLAIVFLVLVAGCVGSPGGRDLDGTVDVYVGNHDRPVQNFEHLNVTVTGVAFVPAERASGDTNTPANGTPPQVFEPSVNRTTVDLTTVQGDSAALVNTVSLPVRDRYRRIAVEVTVTDATLSGGGEATVRAPNGTLTLDTAFGVEPASETRFLLDVTAVGEGNGTYVLTAAGAPVERNLTTPTTGGARTTGTPTPTTASPEGETGGPGTAGNTSTSGTAAATGSSTTSAGTATESGSQ